MLILTITISMLCFLNPALNAFFLLTLCFPGTFCVVHYMKEHNDKKVTRLGLRAIAYLSVASIFWISDKMFCGFWEALGPPCLPRILAHLGLLFRQRRHLLLRIRRRQSLSCSPASGNPVLAVQLWQFHTFTSSQWRAKPKTIRTT